MNRITGAKLFKEPTKWPLIPPWWLVSAPQAAALLNVTPATLSNWRICSEGPQAVPPMYIRPTQGNPIYYRYGDVRAWAASRVGLEYDIEDQCLDFYKVALPNLAEMNGSHLANSKYFDKIYEEGRQNVRSGRDPSWITKEHIEAMDIYFSKQPRWASSKTQDICRQ